MKVVTGTEPYTDNLERIAIVDIDKNRYFNIVVPRGILTDKWFPLNELGKRRKFKTKDLLDLYYSNRHIITLDYSMINLCLKLALEQSNV